jgi:hypothetical protein
MFGPNEVLPEPFGQMYGLEPGCMVISVPGNTILTSRPIFFVFTFKVRFSRT